MEDNKKKGKGAEEAPKSKRGRKASAVKKEERKKRTFANPQTYEEAEAKLPSLEQLAGGITAYRYGEKWKSKEEVLSEGTLIEKLRLLFASWDLSIYMDKQEELTKREQDIIYSSVKTKKDEDIADICYTEYTALKEYGQKMQYVFKRFQVSFSVLATLLHKWESYEYTAQQLTDMYHFMQEVANVKEEALSLLINESVRMHIFEGATLAYDKGKNQFIVNIDDGLYSQILKEAKDATQELSDFKAYAVVAEDYIAKSSIQFIPTTIETNIVNAVEEFYTRYLVKNRSFFRSEMNNRKSEGETITEEEAKRAVIPDYYEVEPSQDMYEACVSYIHSFSK